MEAPCSPHVALSISLRAPLSEAQRFLDYWSKVSFAFESLISDVLCGRPEEVSTFIINWLADPEHRELMKPQDVQGIGYGDFVGMQSGLDSPLATSTTSVATCTPSVTTHGSETASS